MFLNQEDAGRNLAGYFGGSPCAIHWSWRTLVPVRAGENLGPLNSYF